MSVQRVVFDCNVFFQALTSPKGPARRLLEQVARGRLSLFVSDLVLAEVEDVASRPHLAAKYGLTAPAVEQFLAGIRSMATLLGAIPKVFDFPRDPDDAHYVDLALAAGARLIVSRDKDLLSLRDEHSPDGKDFQQRFPDLEILTPPELLSRLDQA